MNEWNHYPCSNYSAEVFPRPIRRVIRFVILANLTVVCAGAILFGIYGGIRAVREVIATPRAHQTSSPNNQHYAHSRKGQRP